MTCPQSPIYDIFHSDFTTDRRTDRSWLWIQLLPFVDVNRIIDAVQQCETTFTEAENGRNREGPVLLFLHKRHIPNIISTADDDQKAHHIEECVGQNDILYGVTSPNEEALGYNSIDSSVSCLQYTLPLAGEHKSALLEGFTQVKLISGRYSGGCNGRKGRGKGRYV